MRTRSVCGSTRTMALRPESVTHAAPSGPTMPPCGLEPEPSALSRVLPVLGSRPPRAPARRAVYQTPPSAAGATTWGWQPAGTAYSCSTSATAESTPMANSHTDTNNILIIGVLLLFAIANRSIERASDEHRVSGGAEGEVAAATMP